MERYTVVGAGPVGIVVGLLLARHGHAVRLLERRPDPERAAPDRGRSINLALAARGIAVLEHCGAMPRIAPLTVTMAGRMLHDEDGAERFMAYGRTRDEVLHAVSRAQLTRALTDAAREAPGIELRFDTRCLDVDPGGSLRLRDERAGREYREPFERLIGADGAASGVRAALQSRGLLAAHEQPLAHDYKELAIPAPAGGLEPHALHVWPRGGYMLIALPNTDGSFTATLFLARVGDPGFDRLVGASDVEQFFQRRFPDAARLLPDVARQFAEHPQGRLSTVRCTPWQAAGRVLLIGDAAHAIVPFHGQGLNCGLEDCLQLERLLGAGTGASAAFAGFEPARRADVEAIAAMALDNYLEMRDRVRSPQFAVRRALAGELEQRFPQRFIPRYAMVMFHPEIPYAEAQRRGARQERLLDALSQAQAGAPGEPQWLALAQRLLDEAGL